MPANTLLYPLDFAERITGETELEQRVSSVESRLKLAALQIVQTQRDALQSTADLRQSTDEAVMLHAPLPRFGASQSFLGTKGFFVGGETATSLTDRIYRLEYGSEALSLSGATLATPRHSGSAANTQQSAFITGGDTSSGTSNRIDRLSFLRETISQLSVTLSAPRSELSAWSTKKNSYFFGGASQSGVLSNIIEKLSQPMNLVSTSGAVLGTGRSNATSLANSSTGYSVGGKTALGNVFTQMVSKFDFTQESIALAGVALTSPTGFSTGVGDQTKGYIVAGRTATGNVATVSKLTYNPESLVLTSVSLSATKSDASAAGSSLKGYIVAGGSTAIGEFRSGSPTTTMDRLTFAAGLNPDRMELLSIQLGTAVVGSAATSDYNPSIDASTGRSVANIFDPIYPRREEIYYRGELRQKLAGDLVVYVNPANTTPGPLGVGTLSNPFPSIVAALDYCRKFDYNGFDLRVEAVAGNYPRSIEIQAQEWLGIETITIRGTISTPGLSSIALNDLTGRSGLFVSGDIRVQIEGFSFSSNQTGLADTVALKAESLGQIIYKDVHFQAGFDVHVSATEGSLVRINGSIQVLGAPTRAHIEVSRGGIWSTGSIVSNIGFIGAMSMPTIFAVSEGGGLYLSANFITFVGVGVVAGKTIDHTGGWIDTDEPGIALADSPFIVSAPGTGYYISTNFVLRGGTQTISGAKFFTNEIHVPTAVSAGQAVNKAQLDLLALLVADNHIAALAQDAFVTTHSNGIPRMITVGNYKIQFGQADSGNPDWNAGGAQTGRVYYPTPFISGFPVVILTLRNGGNVTLNLRDNSHNDYFDWSGDAVRNMDLNIGDGGIGSIQWIAIGY
jgi:hypothetical protein